MCIKRQNSTKGWKFWCVSCVQHRAQSIKGSEECATEIEENKSMFNTEYRCAEVCAAQSSQECASETQNMVLVQPTMCCSTIVGRNVLRPNSRTQSWKNVKVCAAQSWKYVRHNVESMCGTAHRNAAFGAHRHQQQRRVSRQQVSAFHTFLNEEFLAPPTSVVACGLSGAVSLWRALGFGGWANIWGLWNPESGPKETWGSCSNRKLSTFHTFLIEEFLAPTKRHCLCLCLDDLEHLEPGGGVPSEFYLSLRYVASDYNESKLSTILQSRIFGLHPILHHW